MLFLFFHFGMEYLRPNSTSPSYLIHLINFNGEQETGFGQWAQILKNRQFHLYHVSYFCINVCRAVSCFQSFFVVHHCFSFIQSIFLFLLKTNSSLLVLALAFALARFRTEEGDAGSNLFRSRPCSVCCLFLSL